MSRSHPWWQVLLGIITGGILVRLLAFAWGVVIYVFIKLEEATITSAWITEVANTLVALVLIAMSVHLLLMIDRRCKYSPYHTFSHATLVTYCAILLLVGFILLLWLALWGYGSFHPGGV